MARALTDRRSHAEQSAPRAVNGNSPGTTDHFWLTFDVDRNRAITPRGDYRILPALPLNQTSADSGIAYRFIAGHPTPRRAFFRGRRDRWCAPGCVDFGPDALDPVFPMRVTTHGARCATAYLWGSAHSIVVLPPCYPDVEAGRQSAT